MTNDILTLALLFGFPMSLCVINLMFNMKIQERLVDLEMKLHTFMVLESKK